MEHIIHATFDLIGNTANFRERMIRMDEKYIYGRTYTASSASLMCPIMSVDVMPIVIPLTLIVHGSGNIDKLLNLRTSLLG